MNSKDVARYETEVRAAFTMYLQAYFTERDYQKTISLFHPNMCGFGTGHAEVSFSYDDSISRYARDIEQCPAPIEYEERFINTRLINKKTAIIMAGLDIAVANNDELIEVRDLRLSILLLKVQQRWLLQHLHISQEMYALAEGEAFPLREAERKNKLLEEIIGRRTAELTEVLRKLEMAVVTDNLTGLYNRRKFDEMLAAEITQAVLTARPLTLIMADIDYFKAINDVYGHLAGDEILRIIARLLQNHVAESQLAARWGGEEFIILLPQTKVANAVVLAENLRQAVATQTNPYSASLSMSFGVAEYLAGETGDDLLKRLDAALYRAKNLGRNRVEAAV